MSKDIVKSSAQFVYVNDPNRTIRAQIQVGTPLVGKPQWNTRLEVFVPDSNGSSVGDLGFDPSRLVTDFIGPGDEWAIKPMLGLGNQDVVTDGFDGELKLAPLPQGDDGKFRVVDNLNGNGSLVCSVWLEPRVSPDDKIANVFFSEFMISDDDKVRNVFVKYSYECDGVSQHRHAVWGLLRLTPDPITSHQVMWFVNS